MMQIRKMLPVLSLAVLLFSGMPAFAGVTIVYPVKQALGDGSSVQVGTISKGEAFDLAFSDNSGQGFSWDSIAIDKGSLPSGWQVVSSTINDTSLVAKIQVPQFAAPADYQIKVVLSNANKGYANAITAIVSVRENTLDVSFSRDSSNIARVGDTITYKVLLKNNSIAPETVAISSNLPSNWFRGRTVELKPNSGQEVSMAVTPLTSGDHTFTFSAYSAQKGAVVKSFSSELRVLPTLKGKLASMFSGFPIFTFTLLPFQLIDAYISLLFY